MSWRTNRLVLAARNAGRKIGLNNAIAAVVGSAKYEERYDDAFSNALAMGDCVWDIGANVGYYTQLFAKKVGEGGRVYAFEPSPVNYVKLERACHGLPHVHTLRMALGREDRTMPFEQGVDDLGATSRIVTAGNSVDVVNVDVRSGRTILDQGLAWKPNAVKIDTEGFEVEVLDGLGALIDDPALRTIGVEVHFRILESRDLGDGPKNIETRLISSGYRVSWPDASHILAAR